jgi:hypothetical protein
VVKATARIFSSRIDSLQRLSFHTACWIPKIVFSTTSLSYVKTICSNFTTWPHCCHCVMRGGFEVSINSCWENDHTSFVAFGTACLNTSS